MPNAKNEHRILSDVVPNAIGSDSQAPLTSMNSPQLLAPMGIVFQRVNGLQYAAVSWSIEAGEYLSYLGVVANLVGYHPNGPAWQPVVLPSLPS